MILGYLKTMMDLIPRKRIELGGIPGNSGNAKNRAKKL
jgi:hypothetical protein